MKQRNEAGRGFCLAGAFALIALTAAAQRVDVPLKVKTPTMFVDTNALQGVCVAGNLEEKTGSLMSLAALPLRSSIFFL